MSWDCPHRIEDKCIRLKKICLPLQKGCVLDGKVKYIESSPKKEDMNDLHKERKK